ncbi:uncharacterized protein [Argopecten irradians]|uniref:uncharacterized protein n=1 Tax=Argopecten irradians TaxID=31199 RepID=UPI00371D4806
MLTSSVSLLFLLFSLGNAMNLVDLLSKLRRGTGIGGPSSLYDSGVRVNTVSFELPEAHSQTAFQAHLIPQKKPGKHTSNFHGLLRQFSASTADAQTGARYQGTGGYNGPYNPAVQVPGRPRYTSAIQVPHRPQPQQNQQGWKLPNQSTRGGQPYRPGFTQRPVSSIDRFQIPQNTGLMRGQSVMPNRPQVQRQTGGFTRTPVANFGTGMASRKMEFNVPMPVPNQAQMASGFMQDTLPASGRGRNKASQMTGFTRQRMPSATNQAVPQQMPQALPQQMSQAVPQQMSRSSKRFIPKQFPQSAQIGAQAITRNNAFNQNRIPSKTGQQTVARNTAFTQKRTHTTNSGAFRQSARIRNMSPSSVFSRQPKTPMYRPPHKTRTRRF